jgi:hypothetical protein
MVRSLENFPELATLLGEHPPPREDVPDRARERLVPLACAIRCRLRHVVKEQGPPIEGIRSADQRYRAAAVLSLQDIQGFGGC